MQTLLALITFTVAHVIIIWVLGVPIAYFIVLMRSCNRQHNYDLTYLSQIKERLTWLLDDILFCILWPVHLIRLLPK